MNALRDVVTIRNYSGYAEGSTSEDPGTVRRLAGWLGRPVFRHEHIGGAHNPRTTGKASPATTAGVWNPRGSNKNFVIFRDLCDVIVEAGGDVSDLLIEFTLPLGLRNPGVTGKNPDRVRRQLVDVAEGRHKWGYKNAASDNLDYIGSEGNDCIRTYCAEVVGGLDWLEAEYGARPRVACRQGWEFGFEWPSWAAFGSVVSKNDGGRVVDADGIVTVSGLAIEERHGAYWRTGSAIDEWVAAWNTQAAVLAEYGIPTVLCGDKRCLDVLADGRYAGEVGFDVIAYELGPDCLMVGIDDYVKLYEGNQPAFDDYHKPRLGQARFWAEQFGVQAAFGEIGTGSGDPLDGSGAGGVDYGQDWASLLAELASWPDGLVGHVALFVPPSEDHSIARAQFPDRRAAVAAALDVPDVDAALYLWEGDPAPVPSLTEEPPAEEPAPEPEPEPEPPAEEPDDGPMFDPLDLMDAAIGNMADRINEADAATDWNAGMSALLNGLDELQVALGALTAYLREQRQ